ncbi:hypothetical protein J2Z49_000348 [Desulfofundulus luciae]|uniref:(2Fe-2S)-binding protein n=1 Tax=Desulfofundulus luciae TaxID=74702 RepID=A0ABU0AXQ9_9FIRM|nr:(2Fe-2S)-binding protein [Desulfofundulus luciae]MDQ0285255.1 hypothetical protein [Desulfofundulus luciae]
MQNNICGAGLSARPREPCPRCGTPGLPVKVITVSSLVVDEKLPLIRGDSYHLCTSPECSVVYFNGSGNVFEEKDLKVPVWFKKHAGPVPVCYCRGVTDREILAHIEKGCCSSLADIQRHTGANTGKECLTRNPAGR